MGTTNGANSDTNGDPMFFKIESVKYNTGKHLSPVAARMWSAMTCTSMGARVWSAARSFAAIVSAVMMGLEGKDPISPIRCWNSTSNSSMMERFNREQKRSTGSWTRLWI